MRSRQAVEALGVTPVFPWVPLSEVVPPYILIWVSKTVAGTIERSHLHGPSVHRPSLFDL